MIVDINVVLGKINLLLWKLISQVEEFAAMRLAAASDEFEWDDVEASCYDEEVIYINGGLPRDEECGYFYDKIILNNKYQGY